MTDAVRCSAGIHFSNFKDPDEAKEDAPEGTLVAGDEDGPEPDFAAIRAAQLAQREREALNG